MVQIPAGQSGGTDFRVRVFLQHFSHQRGDVAHLLPERFALGHGLFGSHQLADTVHILPQRMHAAPRHQQLLLTVLLGGTGQRVDFLLNGVHQGVLAAFLKGDMARHDIPNLPGNLLPNDGLQGGYPLHPLNDPVIAAGIDRHHADADQRGNDQKADENQKRDFQPLNNAAVIVQTRQRAFHKLLHFSILLEEASPNRCQTPKKPVPADASPLEFPPRRPAACSAP